MIHILNFTELFELFNFIQKNYTFKLDIKRTKVREKIVSRAEKFEWAFSVSHTHWHKDTHPLENVVFLEKSVLFLPAANPPSQACSVSWSNTIKWGTLFFLFLFLFLHDRYLHT
uniref:Uncharacterized protein n=1 Tax=Cacopsylla melanoneura TaxID=428564 RepID=A0A8D9B3V5_9HEMI